MASLGENTDLEAHLISHNPWLMSLIDRGMAEPDGVRLETVERELA